MKKVLLLKAPKYPEDLYEKVCATSFPSRLMNLYPSGAKVSWIRAAFHQSPPFSISQL